MTKIDLNEASLRPASYVQRLLNQAESAKTRVAQLEAERDTAWQELREIRRLIEADENESTADEVARKMYCLSKDAHDAEQERDAARKTIEAIRSMVNAYSEHDTIEAVRRAMEFSRYETARVAALEKIIEEQRECIQDSTL